MGVRKLKALALASVAGLAIATSAKAQIVAPPPARQSVDANGVDLFLGTLNVSSPGISMGDGDTGLSFNFLNNGAGWTDNVTAALNQDGSGVTVRLGAKTDVFIASGTTYTSTEGHGATLTLSAGTYTYTAPDGTVAHFSASKSNPYPYFAGLGRVTDITAPSGKKLVYNYEAAVYCYHASYVDWDGPVCDGQAYVYRIMWVTNSYGYRLNLSYADNTVDPNDATWMNSGMLGGRPSLVPRWSIFSGNTKVACRYRRPTMVSVLQSPMRRVIPPVINIAASKSSGSHAQGAQARTSPSPMRRPGGSRLSRAPLAPGPTAHPPMQAASGP